MSHINVGYLPDRDRYGLWCYVDTIDTHRLITTEGTEVQDPGTALPPTITIDENQAEVLMSRLWGMGIRPSDWGSEGQVDALKDHLADMRKLVFREEGS